MWIVYVSCCLGVSPSFILFFHPLFLPASSGFYRLALEHKGLLCMGNRYCNIRTHTHKHAHTKHTRTHSILQKTAVWSDKLFVEVWGLIAAHWTVKQWHLPFLSHSSIFSVRKPCQQVYVSNSLECVCLSVCCGHKCVLSKNETGSCCACLYFIFEMAVTFCTSSSVSFFNCTFCVHKIHLFFINYSFLKIRFSGQWNIYCCFWTLACISFRNPNLNTAACGFLQKLSMCLLSLSDPSFRACQHGTVCSHIYKHILLNTHPSLVKYSSSHLILVL